MLASSALKSVPCSFFILPVFVLMICWIAKEIYLIEHAEIFRFAEVRRPVQWHYTHSFANCTNSNTFYYIEKNTRIFLKFVFVIVQWNLFIKSIEVCLPENLQTQRTRACWLALKKANIFTAVAAITVSNIVIEWKVSISQRYLKMFGK